ncbi:unnamed protein product [Didymodactylos carnosus]|uniref:Uncharacterized protein n=1 Tax=Didymodactylos carnosus TaxID=1234261 RepID=A0A814NA99_9BILA|nr:unnamed protein product [Didymodactylos carnosus]CAF1334434.1 unnamed protein product [Didymodactylos carnosus]CAF3854553.1 unnamed protein product [Didymodactylos carnosus]CAF4145720.1 unnamed protein product [Didymodactylos carnosus]
MTRRIIEFAEMIEDGDLALVDFARHAYEVKGTISWIPVADEWIRTDHDGVLLQLAFAAKATTGENRFAKHLLENIAREHVTVTKLFEEILDQVTRENKQCLFFDSPQDSSSVQHIRQSRRSKPQEQTVRVATGKSARLGHWRHARRGDDDQHDQ